MIRYIRPEDIPVHYGGLSRPSDLQNGPPKPASEFTVKGGEKVNIQIEGIEVHLIYHPSRKLSLISLILLSFQSLGKVSFKKRPTALTNHQRSCAIPRSTLWHSCYHEIF